MIDYLIITSVINSIASVALALVIYWRRPRSDSNLAFSWFALTGALWSGFYFLWQLEAHAHMALLYTRLLTAAAILIPPAYFHFVVRLVGAEKRRAVAVGHVGAVVFAALSFTSLLVTGVVPKAGFPHWPVPGALYAPYMAFFFVFFAWALALLVQELRRAESLRRNQLLLVTAGTAVGFLGGATNFFLWYDIPIPPVGHGLVAVYVVGVGYAIIRLRLMEFNLLVAKFVALVVAVVLLAAPPFALTQLDYLLGRSIGAEIPLLILMGYMALLLLGVPKVRRRLDSLLEQRVLGDRLADRAALSRLAARISSATDEAAMIREVEETVAAAFHVSDVALYLRTEYETTFTRRGGVGSYRDRGITQFDEISPLVQVLRSAGHALLLEEFCHGTRDPRGDYFSDLRERHGIELAAPAVGDGFLYGFLLLGARGNRALFGDSDIALLEVVTSQVGLNLRSRQLERRASQTEKLISLGTLAAGLAHELRNPLTSIQTFTALMKERNGDADLHAEFSEIVQRDVNRIASIVDNVAAFAESNKVEMTDVRLSDVMRTVAEIVRPELERAEVTLVISPAPVPVVRGNNSQLLQVFLNLVQNAIQALEGRPGSRISVSFESRLTETSQPFVCVTVTDNGPGVDASVLPRIFEPFVTTKATGVRRGRAGMGLGLAIVKRIVQHHRGDIEVTSVVGRGTTFRVHLPQSG